MADPIDTCGAMIAAQARPPSSLPHARDATCVEQFPASPPACSHGVAAGPGERLLSLLAALAAATAQRRRTRRDHSRLMAMSDHELADMGLGRGPPDGVRQRWRRVPRDDGVPGPDEADVGRKAGRPSHERSSPRRQSRAGLE